MKLMVIDGNSLISRAFYGIKPLTTREGLFTNAVYGFVNILLREREREAPDGICVCFDLKEKTFRHKAFEGYKAHRKPQPEELTSQFPLIKEVLDAMGIARLELAGYEADDLLGTLSAMCERSGDDCLLLTGDRDSLQLVGGRTLLKYISTRGGETQEILYDTLRIELDYGLTPAALIDVKAIMGDSSDNIPGVAGIGEKGALELIRRFGSLDGVYDGIDDPAVKKGMRQKLIDGRESAYMSRMLATIDRAVPVDITPAELKLRPMDESALHRLFTRLEFRSLISRLRLSPDKSAPPDIAIDAVFTAALPASYDAELSAMRRAELTGFAADGTLELIYAAYGGKRRLFSAKDTERESWDAFLRAFFAADIQKCAHNAKPVILALMARGLDCGGLCFDTAIAAYLLGEDAALESAAATRFGLELTDDSRDAYAAVLAMTLTPVYTDELRKTGMDRLYFDVELPLITVTASMQHIGFRVDTALLAQFGETLTTRIDELTGLIYNHAGGAFNINSTRQLGELLFVRLELPAVKKTKSGYSTDIEVLQKLAHLHPVVPAVMEYRKLTKLKSTYVDGLLRVVDPADGRIHSSFDQTGAATGRLSSSEPNMQNIPVRTEPGSELRRMFIPEEGYMLADADYSQIELRVLAHIADDERMRTAFLEGGDIHRATAAEVFDVSPDAVTATMRSRAKAVNFGIVYGISDFSLAEDIGVTRFEAKSYIENYLAKYSGVRRYMTDIVKQAERDGYVRTMFGRRRHLPQINARNANTRKAAERIALNTPIQGAAADIIKIAMVRVYKRLHAEGLRSRLILQVHDELIVEAERSECGYVARLLREEMESAAEMTVPLLAEAKLGENWLAAK